MRFGGRERGGGGSRAGAARADRRQRLGGHVAHKLLVVETVAEVAAKLAQRTLARVGDRLLFRDLDRAALARILARADADVLVVRAAGEPHAHAAHCHRVKMAALFGALRVRA